MITKNLGTIVTYIHVSMHASITIFTILGGIGLPCLQIFVAMILYFLGWRYLYYVYITPFEVDLERV